MSSWQKAFGRPSDLFFGFVQVSFLLKDLHFLLKNLHFLLKNLRFLLKNLHFYVFVSYIDRSQASAAPRTTLAMPTAAGTRTRGKNALGLVFLREIPQRLLVVAVVERGLGSGMRSCRQSDYRWLAGAPTPTARRYRLIRNDEFGLKMMDLH